MKSQIKARSKYKYSMPYTKIYRRINKLANNRAPLRASPQRVHKSEATYISGIARCVLSPSRRSCVRERTIRMCCPDNDTPWPGLWQIWRPDSVAAVDTQTGRIVPAALDAHSNQSNCPPRIYHRQTPPWTEPRRAAS